MADAVDPKAVGKAFVNYAKRLKIDSKEEGVRPLFPLLGTQRYVLGEILTGLEEGVHNFVILKGRQQGITTVLSGLDLWWCCRYPGTMASLIADNESNRDKFKDTIQTYIESLPPQYKPPGGVKAHNRSMLALGNRSRIIYQIAGTKTNLKGTGGTTRGKGLSYVHGTECSSWANQTMLASLMASLAEKNPQRLYAFESTALGYNNFYDMWDTAKRAVTQKAIFSGWWRHEGYAAPEESKIFQVYGDPNLSGEEREWVRAIKKMYGYDITPHQLAWWRYQLEEIFSGDETMLTQEHPPTEEHAFVLSGSQFFHGGVISDIYKWARQYKPSYMRYMYGDEFVHTKLLDSHPKGASLLVWEQPVEGATYVISGDPAYGSSEWADNFCVQVFRCYADELEQVAEFCTTDCQPYQFAWVICHLAGAYKNSRMILEINGPGAAVLDEIKNLRRQAYSRATSDQDKDALRNVVGGIKEYLYRRVDSVGGTTGAKHWKTSFDNKQRFMNLFRDCVTRNLMKLRSTKLVEEMRTVVREDGGDIKAAGRAKDDRVIAAALAAQCWMEQVRPALMAVGKTKKQAEEQAKAGMTGNRANMVSVAAMNYLASKGVA